ncbi:unnamed protein product [Pleuronectes platessa]|uniref:Ig-like domain-containing protein n=1 Tax=Pleuronectes platessa TaxID=8262 RepID=A0A9N7U8A7_PLEPL|nr:unnamed protein product [Pleuronectes platessa]
MRKAEVQMTLKTGADEAVAPRSPIVPPKRSKASPEKVVAEPRGPGHPVPTPPAFVRKMRNAAVGTGCDIRLKVTVAGDPQPSLYWYHNEDLLNMENQEYGGLWIRDCKPSDAGLYTCIANNHLGEIRSSAVLAVLDLGEGNSQHAHSNIFVPGKVGTVGTCEQPVVQYLLSESEQSSSIAEDVRCRLWGGNTAGGGMLTLSPAIVWTRDGGWEKTASLRRAAELQLVT